MIERSIKPGELDDIPASYGWDYQDGDYYPYKQKPGMEKAFLLGDNGQRLCCASEYDAVAAIYIVGEGPKRPGAGRKNKYERGLCCWHSCQEKATVTVRTPGENIRDNEEFIVCPRHWDMLLVAIKRLEDMGIIEPILPVGDPTCEQCHGKGCAQCSDTIYYAEEDAASQDRRDRAIDRSDSAHYRVN